MLPAHFKKILASLCAFALFFLLIPQLSFAQTYDSNVNYGVERNIHTNAQVILIDVTSAIICQLIGIDVVNPNQPCLGIDRTTNTIGYAPPEETNKPYAPKIGGAVGLLVSAIGMTYNVPIHTSDYTSYLASNFGFVKPVYAATGFQNLKSLVSIWARIRDLTYLFFVLIFVIIGFAIMLRLKIDPRTAMTIQNQIPKIIIALVLITFSYSIAGLLIDTMWVVTYTGINLITGNELCTDKNTSLTEAATVNLNNNPIEYTTKLLGCSFGWNNANFPIAQLASNVGQKLGDTVSYIILSIIGAEYNDAQKCGLTDFGCWGNKILFNTVKWIISVLAMLAIILAILFQLFRVWLMLIKAYLYVVYYTIMSPIWIMMSALPVSSKMGFVPWLQHMGFALSVYPVTAFFFTLGAVIAADPSFTGASPDDTFMPPLVANPTLINNLGYVFALAVILLAPEIEKMMRSAFKSEPSKYTPAINAALTAGAGAIAPVGKYLFGKDKQGRVGPATYWGRRGLASTWSHTGAKIPVIKNIPSAAGKVKTAFSRKKPQGTVYSPYLGQYVPQDMVSPQANQPAGNASGNQGNNGQGGNQGGSQT